MGKGRQSASSSSATPRVERKIIEKNRRNHMKTLFSNLISLLPNHSSKGAVALPDQIDEAVEHIKSLKASLERSRQKKERLSILPRQGSSSQYSCNSTCSENQHSAAAISKRAPLVEFHDNIGPNMDIILAQGLQDFSAFHSIVASLHQPGVEIAAASFTKNGNSTLQVLHQEDKVHGKSKLGSGGATVSGMLEELVSGTSSSSTDVAVGSYNLDLWDYGIETNIWGFPRL